MEICYLETGSPFQGRKKALLQCFLKEQGLDYDENIAYSILLVSSAGEILAAGSRRENVLECLAVADHCQGEGLMNRVVGQLVSQAHTCGISHLFLFTKPAYRELFQSLNFYPLLETGKITFMENTPHGLEGYLRSETSRWEAPTLGQQREQLPVGAIVMNANPFTNGHLHLVQEACRQCRLLHLFVLSAQQPPFPAQDRRMLVEQGCAHLKNVIVHGTSDYLISHATFPDYFIKDKDTASAANGELDLLLFCKYFAPAFGIQVRFVGDEPFSPLTDAYNRQMMELLPPRGVQVKIIPRKTWGHVPISATAVRRYYQEEDLDGLLPLVPPSTYAYLEAKLKERQ